ncbi:MAG: GNAT family N-acetyltransferase [Vicingaceae bacterium]
MEYCIRKYKTSDESALLAVFDSNVPEYFNPEERKPFLDFLQEGVNGQELYEVLELNGSVIAAGGYRIEKPGDARICWLMVERSQHQKGWGKCLLEGQMKRIEDSEHFNMISLMTSQHTDEFYEKMGFVRTDYKEDYWAKGMHLVMMEKSLKKQQDGT